MNDHDRLAELRLAVAQSPGELTNLEFLLDYLDRRQTELLQANNRLVSERNIERGKRIHYQDAVEYLLAHNGMKQLREADNIRRHLIAERDLAQDETRRAWAEAERYMVLAQSAPQALITKVLNWYRALRTFEQAKAGKGKVLEANRAYTEAYLALKAEAAAHITDKP